ncbi:MAG: O-phosphoseryl-tRNA(Sec) selenium transferase [Candidatus Thorarchaeota archaeon]
MDIDEKLAKLIPEGMAERGRITMDSLLAPVKDVLNRRKFPEKPLADDQIELMFRLLASMDTDKDPAAARVGEREARVASPYISQLAAGFNHGIGRSGHVAAPQPKAPGASMMQQVANTVVLDAIRVLGLPNVRAGLVLPLATGMAIGLVLSALRRATGINTVLLPRLDHTSPEKGVKLTGLNLLTTPTFLEDDAVRADLGVLEKEMAGGDSCAVLATTTFFPPREPDPVKEIARLCSDKNVPLVINNAYGVQSEKVMKSLKAAIDAGRVDAIVQSSDKNFLAPVGASIVASPSEENVIQTAESYAGRASASPVAQTLAALLALGRERYMSLRAEQVENRTYLETRLTEIAESIGQRVLAVENTIACAMTLDGLDAEAIGGHLYNARVTGPRAIPLGGFGSCIEDYPHSYIVMNAAIGATHGDIEKATTKLFKEVSG